jgi:hypothetical protein
VDAQLKLLYSSLVEKFQNEPDPFMEPVTLLVSKDSG